MTAGLQYIDHHIVGLPHEQATDQRRAGDELAVVADRVVGRQIVFLADKVVVQAVRRRGMHQPGTRFQRDMLAADDRHGALMERVLQRQHFQCCTFAMPNRFAAQLITLQATFHQLRNQQQITFAGLDQAVLMLGMHAHRLIGGQRPRRGGPDHRIYAGIARQRHAERLFQRVPVLDLEAHVDRGRSLVLIFHFCLGQCRLAIQAPVHRLASLVQIAALVDAAERAHDVGLGLEVHRQVRMIPVAQHAEADEVLLLPLDLLLGIGAAQLAELRRRNRLAVFFLHLQLDRQAVAIPARHIGRVETRQRLALDDDVLENFVHRMADMDVAVRIRRAVVQDEFRLTLPGRADFLVALLRLPARHHLRLALGEVAAHRERGVGEI